MRERTKTQPTYGATPEFEPRPHWWAAPPNFPHDDNDDDDDDDDDDNDDDDDSQRESSLTVYLKAVMKMRGRRTEHLPTFQYV